MPNQIITEVLLDLDRMKQQLKEAEKDGKDSGDKIGQSIGSSVEDKLGAAAGNLKAKLLALAAAVAGAFAFKHIIEASMEGQRAVNGLANAMRLQGTYSEEAMTHMQGFNEALSHHTTVSKGALMAGETLLMNIGKLRGEGLERATTATLDLAAATGKTAEEAFQIMSRAAAGNVTALGRMGIKFQQTGVASIDFARALGVIEARFKGLAEQKANTFEGALTGIEHGFHGLVKTAGDFIVKSPVVIAVMKLIGDGFQVLGKAFKGFSATGEDPLGGFIMSLIKIAGLMTQYVIPPFELLYNIGKFVFNGLAFLVNGFYSDLIDGTLKVVSLINSVTGKFGDAKAVLEDLAGAAKATTAQLASDTSNSMGKIFDFGATDSVDTFLSNLEQKVAASSEKIKHTVQGNLVAATQAMLAPAEFLGASFQATFSKAAFASENFRNHLQQLSNQAFTQFRNGFTSAFAAIGTALVKGTNVLEGFGKAVLGMFGDLALQLGQFYFLLGLANLWLNPAAAAGQIAAGIALSILGGALKAIAGGGGEAASGGGVAAGGGGTAGSAEVSSQAKTEAAKPQTNVHVNVHGNVLDRRQTGLELAEVIQEAFDTQGIVTAGAR